MRKVDTAAAQHTMNALTVDCDQDLHAAEYECLLPDRTRSGIDELGDQGRVHQRNLGIEQIGGQPHPEQTAATVAVDLAHLESGLPTWSECRPGEIGQVQGTTDFHRGEHRWYGEENRRQPCTRGGEVDQGNRLRLRRARSNLPGGPG